MNRPAQPLPSCALGAERMPASRGSQQTGFTHPPHTVLRRANPGRSKSRPYFAMIFARKRGTLKEGANPFSKIRVGIHCFGSPFLWYRRRVNRRGSPHIRGRSTQMRLATQTRESKVSLGGGRARRAHGIDLLLCTWISYPRILKISSKHSTAIVRSQILALSRRARPYARES